MRERGSEGIACLKGDAYSFSGYPNIVHRPIGRFVVSGRGVDDNSHLEVDDSSVCSGILLSPCREAVNNPSMCLVYDCFPPLSSCQKQKWLSPVDSSPFIPVCSSVAWGDKKRRIAPMGQLCDSSIQKGGDSFRMSFYRIVDLDTEAKYGNNSQTCK